MTGAQPSELVRLLGATDQASQDQAWDAFVHTFSRLLISTARRFGGDGDAAMDRYAYVLDKLRCDEFKRLRGYAADGRGKFTTWLVVVARRLCLDYRRQRYGRPRGEADGVATVERAVRRRLVDFLVEDLDESGPLSAREPDAEMKLRAVQLQEALHGALRTLPARDRLLLALRYEEGMTAGEIAVVMRFPSLFHVYRRLNTIQRSLRQTLERRGVGDAAP